MSWPEQRVSPPIYNIKARYVAVAALFLSLAKLYRQTFHRVREAPCFGITPSIYTHYRFSYSLLPTPSSSNPLECLRSSLANTFRIGTTRSKYQLNAVPITCRTPQHHDMSGGSYAPRTCRLFQEWRDNGKT